MDLFTQIFLNGFNIQIRSGISIKEVLFEVLGLDDHYIEHRIQTIFLNGKTVDDINTSRIQNDSTLALSAAMPGLVGATFRRSGRYASMRKQISHKRVKSSALSENDTTYITIKLFNLIAKEIGPICLSKGVVIKGRDLRDMISLIQKKAMEDFGEIYMDEKPIDLDQLLITAKDEENIFLLVNFT